jgi:thioredoxin reductase (NADPH)
VDDYDAIIVGAGPAGLTAATYLGRYRRRVLVLDGGPSRAGWIPESHNTPGFPEGVSGEALLARLRAQALRYGARILAERAESIEHDTDGFRLALGAGPVRSRFVVLATGLLDRKPPLAGIDDAIKRSVVRLCPICDAYEAIDARIAVLGDGDAGAREALYLRTYSPDVALLTLSDAISDTHALDAAGVRTLHVAIEDVSLEGGAVTLRAEGSPRTFDYLYLALGCDLQSNLATGCGADHDAVGNLVVDAHQRTSVDGLYAVGDVSLGLNQIAVATGEAAIAATDIHNRLRKQRS